MAGPDRSQLPYWEMRAANWRYAPPMSPCAEDVAWYEEAAHQAASAAGPAFSALLLGVTPSIALMRWPEGTRLVAVDWAAGMLRNVWPARGVPSGALPVRADWRQLPLADASVDFVVGDNCYAVLASFEEALAATSEVRRVLRPAGIYCQRCLCGPGQRRSVDALFEDLFEGRVRHLDFFRFQLALAIQDGARIGIALNDVWEVWNRHVPNPRLLEDRYDWRELGLANMNAWKGSAGRYCFLPEDALAELAGAHFDLAADRPRYTLGENFMRLLMRPRVT